MRPSDEDLSPGLRRIVQAKSDKERKAAEKALHEKVAMTNLQIWYRPIKALKKVLDDPDLSGAGRSVVGAGVFLPIAQLFILKHAWAAATWSGMFWNLFVFLVLGLISAYILSEFVITQLALLLHRIGSWLGGNAELLKLQAIITWSSVPFTTSLLLVGMISFRVDHHRAWFWLIGNLVFVSVCYAWSCVLLIQGLMQAQNFSVGRATASYLIYWSILSAIVLLTGLIALHLPDLYSAVRAAL